MLKQASTNKVRLLDLLMITIGCGIYALGFVKINIANRLAEGGVTGISLIIYHLFHVDPSISTFCINIPLIVIGYRLLGRRALIYTVYGTIWLSVWIWIWQRVPFTLDIQHDLFISGVLAGLIGGFAQESSTVLMVQRAGQMSSHGCLKGIAAFPWGVRF